VDKELQKPLENPSTYCAASNISLYSPQNENKFFEEMNMKKNLIKLMAPVAVLVAMSSHAFAGQQGYGQSQQDDGDSAGFYADSPDFAVRAERWCDDVVRDLKETKHLAEEQADYSPARAEATLIARLHSAASNPYLRKGPMTARAIFRGSEVIQIMRNAVSGQENATDSVLDFTLKYYDFIINTAENLDRPHYQDGYRGRDGYESQLTQFIHNEVQFVLDTLAENTDRGVFPKGSTEAFLNELLASIRFVSRDLQELEVRDEYACAVKYLNRLADEIRNGDFPGQREAMNEVYSRASRLINEIQPHCGCFSWNE
jgi:hypothetical protein